MISLFNLNLSAMIQIHLSVFDSTAIKFYLISSKLMNFYPWVSISKTIVNFPKISN